MKILLVANKGKLYYAVEEELSKNNYVYSFLLNKEKNFCEIIDSYREIFFRIKFDIIVFISGETRDENKMMMLNYLIPKEILNLCQFNYIYL